MSNRHGRDFGVIGSPAQQEGWGLLKNPQDRAFPSWVALVALIIGCACSGVGGCCGSHCAASADYSEVRTGWTRCSERVMDSGRHRLVAQRGLATQTCDQGLLWSLISLRGGARERDREEERAVSLAGRSRAVETRELERRKAPAPRRDDFASVQDPRVMRDGDGGRGHFRDVGEECLSIVRSMGGTAALPRIVARWKQLHPRDFLSRDGTRVYRGQVSVCFEEAMEATRRVTVTRDKGRPDLRLFSLTSSPPLAGSSPVVGSAAGQGGGPPPVSQAQQQFAPNPQLPPGAHMGSLPKYLVLHKTRMCRDWVQTGKCQFEGHCSFAHGRHELRIPGTQHADQLPPDARVMMHKTPAAQTQAAQSLSQLPVPIDPAAENFTFTGKVARVMASENYPIEAHFCITESAPLMPDIFVSRKVVGDELWKELQQWWMVAKGIGKPFMLNLTCQAFKKGSNNYRATAVIGKVDVPDEPAETANGTQDTAAGADTDGEAIPTVFGMMRGKALGGDFLPKLGYQCVISSSGKNFSFADDCIYIRNELRDANGVKGLWVGDIVTVDAAYNMNKGNWVATAVTLVKRNNSGFLSMQDAMDKIAAQRQAMQQAAPADANVNNVLPASAPAGPAQTSSEAAAAPEATAQGVQLPLASGNLSAVLQDPVMLQNLIAALQQQQQQRVADTRDEPWKTLYKTEMCQNLLASGRCRYGSKCTFAHSKEELRGADGQPLEHAAKRTERPEADSDSERSGRKRARSEEESGTLSMFTEAEICAGELFVGGLPRRRYATEHLRNVFSKYGEVKDCRIIMDMTRTPPTSRGYGFVTFADTRDNLKAVKALDRKRIAGRFLRVTPAESRAEEDAAQQGDDDQDEADLLADDYVDPKQQLSPAMAPEGGYEEDQFVCQKGHEGPMHVAMMQGLPNYMEDNWGVKIGTPPTCEDGDRTHKDSINMFGVFDGHNGYRGSLYAREMLLRNIDDLLPDTPSVDDIVRATHEGYLKTDADFLAMGMGDGACMVTLAVSSRFLIAANAGDSRAVLGTNGTAVELTLDHKPGRPDEQQRIEGLGGFVVELGVPRVMGYLAVSRALGDAQLKQFVIADPETRVVSRDKDQTFVVLATDGLWDVMSSDEAVQFVYQHWDLPDHGAELLVKEALGRFSSDNICAMVVDVRTAISSMHDVAPDETASAAHEAGEADAEAEAPLSSGVVAAGAEAASEASEGEGPNSEGVAARGRGRSRKLVKDEGKADGRRKRKERGMSRGRQRREAGGADAAKESGGEGLGSGEAGEKAAASDQVSTVHGDGGKEGQDEGS